MPHAEKLKNHVKLEGRSAESFPFSVVTRELDSVQKLFRALLRNYAAEVESRITALQTAVHGQSVTQRKLPISIAHDLRDMLMLMRSLDVKPAKGRRRDLKRLEVVVDELQRIAATWD